MSDVNKLNVGFQQVGCLIFTSRMSDVGFFKSDVGSRRMLASWMSDFNKSNVGCRILTSRMSDFNKSDV